MITSNGGVTLLRRADERLDLTPRLAACFTNHRRPELVVHDVETLVLQRLYGLARAYEDLNDHEDLRRDPALQAVAGRTTPRRADCAPLVGKSTVNRLELAAAGRDDKKARKIVVDTERLDELLVALCVESFASEPAEVVLDLDATDIPLHGDQEERFFPGYYREYCYIPLLFLIGQPPVLVRMRSAARDAAPGVEDELGWLLDRLLHHCHIVNIRGNSYRMRKRGELARALHQAPQGRTPPRIPVRTRRAPHEAAPTSDANLRSLRSPN